VRVRDLAGNAAEETRRFRVYTGPGLPPNPYADSVLYTGGGEGIKVSFRVKHHRLVMADFAVRLRCVGPKGHYHRDHQYLGFAEPGWAALPLDSRNRFRFGPISWEEPGSTIEKKLVGTVHHGSIVGRLAYSKRLDYLSCWAGTRSDEDLHFRAYIDATRTRTRRTS